MSQSARNTIAVFASDSFVVTDGVAEGEAVSFMDELTLDDVCQLTNGSRRHALTYVRGEDNGFILAEDTAVAPPPQRALPWLLRDVDGARQCNL